MIFFWGSTLEFGHDLYKKQAFKLQKWLWIFSPTFFPSSRYLPIFLRCESMRWRGPSRWLRLNGGLWLLLVELCWLQWRLNPLDKITIILSSFFLLDFFFEKTHFFWSSKINESNDITIPFLESRRGFFFGECEGFPIPRGPEPIQKKWSDNFRPL